MSRLFLIFELRLLPFVMAMPLTAAFALLVWLDPQEVWLSIGLAVAGFFLLVGLHDLMQPNHSVLRNYPISAHLRFILEAIRPEMRQYFFEDDKDGTPFSRDSARSSTSAPRGSSTSGRSAPSYDVYSRRLRMDAPFDRAAARRQGAVPHHDRRRRLHQALLGLGVQHLGDELRRAVAPTPSAR